MWVRAFVLQVGNLGLLFMLLFFIYAALGVELFGELGKCTISSCDATKDYVALKSHTNDLKQVI